MNYAHVMPQWRLHNPTPFYFLDRAYALQVREIAEDRTDLNIQHICRSSRDLNDDERELRRLTDHLGAAGLAAFGHHRLGLNHYLPPLEVDPDSWVGKRTRYPSFLDDIEVKTCEKAGSKPFIPTLNIGQEYPDHWRYILMIPIYMHSRYIPRVDELLQVLLFAGWLYGYEAKSLPLVNAQAGRPQVHRARPWDLRPPSSFVP